jgi:hypothetical protein
MLFRSELSASAAALLDGFCSVLSACTAALQYRFDGELSASAAALLYGFCTVLFALLLHCYVASAGNTPPVLLH